MHAARKQTGKRGALKKYARAVGPVVAALAVFGLLIVLFFQAPRKGALAALHFFDGAPASLATSTAVAPGTHDGTFSDPSIGFSFAVPSGYHTARNLSDSGETVLVQPEASSSSANDGVEVYVRTYSGTAADITVKNIQSQTGLTVQNPIAISIAGAQGLGFVDASSQPPLYDAWFVHNGYLFQTLAWKSNATLLKSVLASWRFN